MCRYWGHYCKWLGVEDHCFPRNNANTAARAVDALLGSQPLTWGNADSHCVRARTCQAGALSLQRCPPLHSFFSTAQNNDPVPFLSFICFFSLLSSSLFFSFLHFFFFISFLSFSFFLTIELISQKNQKNKKEDTRTLRSGRHNSSYRTPTLSVFSILPRAMVNKANSCSMCVFHPPAAPRISIVSFLSHSPLGLPSGANHLVVRRTNAIVFHSRTHHNVQDGSFMQLTFHPTQHLLCALLQSSLIYLLLWQSCQITLWLSHW